MHLPAGLWRMTILVQFSCSVMSDFATPWTAARQASLSITTPGAYSNSRPLCQWRYLTISSYVNPFSSRLQSFPASGSFPMSRFFASGSQSIGVSASVSVLPMNIQDWYPLGNKLVWSPCSPRDSQRVFSNTTDQKHQCSAFFIVQLSHPYMTTGKTIALTIWNFVGKVMSLLLNMLSRLVKAFLPRSVF